MRYIGLALISLFLGLLIGTDANTKLEEQTGESHIIGSVLLMTAIIALPLFGIALLIWG